jgi:hypothetical protein
VNIAQEDDMTADTPHVIWFEELGRGDVPRVGGKNAPLGEMVGNLAAKGAKVPPGFATTAEAYWRFAEQNSLKESIASALPILKPGARRSPRSGRRSAVPFCADWSKEIADRLHLPLLCAYIQASGTPTSPPRVSRTMSAGTVKGSNHEHPKPPSPVPSKIGSRNRCLGPAW